MMEMDPPPALELWQILVLYETHGLHQLAALAIHLLYLPVGNHFLVNLQSNITFSNHLVTCIKRGWKRFYKQRLLIGQEPF